MLWGKKKKRRGTMIDVGELQRQGRVRAPKTSEPRVETNGEGFVDVMKVTQGRDNTLVDVSETVSVNKFSTERDGYSKREVDAKIQQLDSMIYKLEQRIEVLERKAGVDSGTSSNSTVGAMGW